MVHDALPFALPDVGEEEVRAVSSALRSGWLSSGPRVREFEMAFAAFLGDGIHAVSVNSATAGLHLALESVGLAPGDEVLVPTWTFTATAEVVRYLGGIPVLVDIDPLTFNLDFEAAELRVTPRTRAVMPVHFGGLAVNGESINVFARKHGLEVIEDAAHALPATTGGELVGASASAATVFSFYATKTMTTGEGGMLVTRHTAVAERARMMRLHGISRDAFDRYRSSVPSWHYEVVAPGYKYNMTDPAAAMGLVQLTRLMSMRNRRAKIASRYDEGLQDLSLRLPAHAPRGEMHAWHLYVVRLPGEMDRSHFVNEMARRGVSTSVHFIPLHLHPYWQQFGGYRPVDLPVATAEFEHVVSLPIFSSMTEGDVDRVIAAVRELVPQ